MTPRLYQIHTTAGVFHLYATTQPQAITSALELAGPIATVLRVGRVGQW